MPNNVACSFQIPGEVKGVMELLILTDTIQLTLDWNTVDKLDKNKEHAQN